MVPAHLFLALSAAAYSGSDSPQTMQFSRSFTGKEVRILVDSGSSHSFVSASVASSVQGQRALPIPMQVCVADGNLIQCSTELHDVEWQVQGFRFHSTLCVLPLAAYDLILGMDWLEAFSPMKVNWRSKWMSIPYGPGTALLHGLSYLESECDSLQLFSISSSASDTVPPAILPEVQLLLDDFHHLFTEPTTLPPRRDCDHTIPLILGAQPVAVRQYRYSPKLKSEIEAQVSELLKTGMIQPSRSPFSSPVLLVKKKDKSWRMCVDYRMLNPLLSRASSQF